MEGQTMEHELWCVYVAAQDRLYACPSLSDAMAMTVELNVMLINGGAEPCATLERWPHDVDSHTANLAEHWDKMPVIAEDEKDHG